MWGDKPHSPKKTFLQIDKFAFSKNYDNNKNILQPKYFKCIKNLYTNSG